MLYRLHIFFIVFLVALTYSTQLLFAQGTGIEPGETAAQPKDRTRVITATVVDIIPPSVPILIEPEDNELLNTSKPSFVWEESTDNLGVTSYSLYLDGEEYFSDIPTTDTDTNVFRLEYDPVSGHYTLTPKSSISNGTHTWKIVAFDAAGNQASSVTWTFKIDTRAPTLVINTIGNTTVSISSQDESTVPTSPIELDGNEPLLTGTGEAQATVEVTLSTEGESNRTYTFTVSSDGTWSLQLPTLTREKTYILDFLITDKAGNVSVIENVQFIIKQAVITIPPIPFLPPPLQPPTEIPITPPKEIITDVIDAIPTIPITRPSTGSLASSPLNNQGSGSVVLSQPFPLVFSLVTLLLMIKLLLIIWPVGLKISLQFLIHALGALFAVPWLNKPKQGLAFELVSGRPIPFLPLHVYVHTSTQNSLHTTVISNAEGIYTRLSLENITISLLPFNKSYLFPVVEAKPSYLSQTDFYKGENLAIQEFVPMFFIPLSQITDRIPLREQILAYFTLTKGAFSFLLSCTSIIITIISPNLYNLVITILLISLQLLTWLLREKNSVKVVSTSHEVVPYGVLKTKYQQLNEVVDFSVGNNDGTLSLPELRDNCYYELYARKHIFLEFRENEIIVR